MTLVSARSDHNFEFTSNTVHIGYLLSKIEQRLGSPEKPLSSLGALGYKSYWTLAIMRFLRSVPDNVPVRLQGLDFTLVFISEANDFLLSLTDISTGTSMTMEDVCNTLIQLNMIFIGEASPPPIRPSPGQTIKFPKGRKNGVARKHLQRIQTQDKEVDGVKAPFVVPKNYEIQFDRTKVEAYLSNWESKGYLKLKPEKLQWTPYIMTRNPKETGVNIDLPAMDTVTHYNSRIPFVNGQAAESMAGLISESVPESISEPLPEFGSERGPESIAESIAEPTTDLVTEASEEAMVEDFAELVAKSAAEPVESIAGPSKNPVRPTPDAMIIDSPALMQVIEDDELPAVPSTPSRSRQSSTRSSVKLSLTTKSPSPSPPTPPPPPPPPRTLRSSRSQAKYVSPPMEIDAELTPVRRGRPPKRRPKMDVEDDDDEALAAKLGNEEQGQWRQLRSRRSVERKRAVTPISIPKVPPGRKRRRIESSPETRESSPEEIDGEANGKHREYYDECQSETQTPEGVTNGVMKSEPLTHPSDDTIFMAEVHVKGFTDFRGAVHAESDLRSTLGPDEWHDEDADGEYEEDAEGEVEEGYY